MRNIDKRPYRADGGDIGTGRIREIADNPYGDEEKCWLAKRVLALLDELEAKDQRISEMGQDLIKPLPIGELLQRLENQTGEPWGDHYLSTGTGKGGGYG